KLYKQKRKFDKTPEPSGQTTHHKGQLKFVIQKHDATRLHYDFRLEADGVLKSWAVPKGPSLNPSDKRLAMMVEDHPFDYRNFEGVIPEGNYGAGNVIIWDEGTYESVSDPKNSDKEIGKEIKAGSVKFRLFGKKLHGLWALVKLKHADEENAWLLIKDRDEYASEKDITEEDKSVKSNQTVDEIGNTKSAKDEIAELKDGIKKGNPPEFIKPMLATLVDKPFDNDNFLFEIKWDGYRALADKRKNKVNLYSRNNISFNKDYESIVESVKKLPFDAVLDGEIVIVDKIGRPNFQALQNYKNTKEGNLVYYVFDILYLNGYKTMDLPLTKRKELLAQIIPNLDNIKVSTHIENDGIKFFQASKKQNLEGIIAKKKDSTYQAGVRSDSWLKIKSHARQEAIICGFTKPQGSRKHFGALILGIYKNGELTYIGHTGGGFDEASLLLVYEKLKKIEISKSPFKEIPDTNAPATWVKPELICEVSFAGWTDNNHMRQPIFEGLREDKSPKDVGIEEEKSEKELINKGPATFDKVKISNPNKVFWPKEKYTKGDLFKYYDEVANLILPYLKDRPESLRRYPNGITSDGFFQKDIEYKLPSFAKKFTYHSESEARDVKYLICNNRETLIYMINLGCIDINPWNSTTKNIENPDYIIIDLDPEEIGFEKVVDAAIEVRKLLEEIDIASYPKTSGATGMHIYIPTGAKYTYDQIKSFAEIIVNIINQRNPSYTSVLRLPEKRKGKVYLDFLQNRIGQTLAAPYSVRPKPGATVSTPLEWHEVNKKLLPTDFTIKNMMKRVDKVGDLWKPVLGEGIDIKKTLKNLEKIQKA
ncbi:MAG TPA: DNA ligase D, partial [Patescibacteria group bacterium]|nr:DNA ligase D [Patescibacteria group bacterium]